jgi:hypothetical protein
VLQRSPGARLRLIAVGDPAAVTSTTRCSFRVGFGGVQDAEAGEGVAAAGRRLACGLGEREAGERVVLAVEGDVAVS